MKAGQVESIYRDTKDFFGEIFIGLVSYADISYSDNYTYENKNNAG
jgi:hypothetical protein